jgi:hypothetical protein
MLLFQLSQVITNWEKKPGKIFAEIENALGKRNDALALQKTREFGACIKDPFERAWAMLHLMVSSVAPYESKGTFAEASKIAESSIYELSTVANIYKSREAQRELLKLYNEFAILSYDLGEKIAKPDFNAINAMFSSNLPTSGRHDDQADGFFVQDKTAVAAKPVLPLEVSKETRRNDYGALLIYSHERGRHGDNYGPAITCINGLELTLDEKKERLTDFMDLMDMANHIIGNFKSLNIPYVVDNAQTFLKLYDELLVSFASHGCRIDRMYRNSLGNEFFSSTETAEKLVRGLVQVGSDKERIDILRNLLDDHNDEGVTRLLKLIEDNPAFAIRMLDKHGEDGLEFSCNEYLFPFLKIGKWGENQVLKYTDIAVKAGAVSVLNEMWWYCPDPSKEVIADAFFLALNAPAMLSTWCKIYKEEETWHYEAAWKNKSKQELSPIVSFCLLERDKSLMPFAEKNPVAFGMLATQFYELAYYGALTIGNHLAYHMFIDIYLSEIKDAVFSSMNDRPGLKRLIEEKPQLLVDMLWQPGEGNALNLARAMRDKEVDRLLMNDPYAMVRICSLCGGGAHAAFNALAKKKVRDLIGGAAGYADLVAKYGVVDLSVVMDCKGVKEAKTAAGARDELKRRLEIFSRLGLKFSNRYDGEILENIYLTATKGSAGGKKLAYIAMNKWDPPGLLELVGLDGLFSQSSKQFHLLIDNGYDLIITENNEDGEMAERFFKHGFLDNGANEALKRRKYDVFSVAGHGSQTEILLSSPRRVDSEQTFAWRVEIGDYDRLSSFGDWNSMLTDRAVVVLASCFTGYLLSDNSRAERSPKRLFEKLTKKKVVAPTVSVATATPVFDKDGYVIDADYVKLTVGGVVSYKIAKLLGLDKYVTLSGDEMKQGK